MNDEYVVKLYVRAYRDLDEIYRYISNNLSELHTASKLIDELENAIFSLESFPERGAIRQLFHELLGIEIPSFWERENRIPLLTTARSEPMFLYRQRSV